MKPLSRHDESGSLLKPGLAHDVFFCYSRADEAVVRRIFDDLTDQGLRPWFDKESIRPGESWPEALQRGLDACQCFAVFIGPSGLSSFQRSEIQTILAKPSRAVIPVLLCGAAKDPSLPSLLRSRQTVDFRRSPARGIRDLVWGVTGRRLNENLFEALLSGQGQDSRRARPSIRRSEGSRMLGDHRQMTLPGMHFPADD